jgi:hypothetical protein
MMKATSGSLGQKRIGEAVPRTRGHEGELSEHLPVSFLKFLRILERAQEVTKDKTVR